MWKHGLRASACQLGVRHPLVLKHGQTLLFEHAVSPLSARLCSSSAMKKVRADDTVAESAAAVRLTARSTPIPPNFIEDH